jgi:hypothetical protein
MIAVDANFKLKSKNVPNSRDRVSLSGGCAYYTDEPGYLEHIAKYSEDLELSTCIGLSAMEKANRSPGKLRTTGIGSVICARHQVILPNAVGDMQKGER